MAEKLPAGSWQMSRVKMAPRGITSQVLQGCRREDQQAQGKEGAGGSPRKRGSSQKLQGKRKPHHTKRRERQQQQNDNKTTNGQTNKHPPHPTATTTHTDAATPLPTHPARTNIINTVPSKPRGRRLKSSREKSSNSRKSPHSDHLPVRVGRHPAALPPL
jgi:hypothetical protein